MAVRSLRLRSFGSTSRIATTAPLASPPLFQLQDAVVKHLATPATLSLTIPDASDRIFALVGPSSSSGPGKALQLTLLAHLLGHSRPQQRAEQGLRLHGHLHPFVGNNSRALPERVQHASFVRQHDAGAGGGEFSNFTARYGALRGEEQTTLFEALMEVMGFYVGRIARAKIVEDPLRNKDDPIDEAGAESQPHVLPSGIATEETRRAARAARDCIEEYAKLFALDKPGPGSGGDGKGRLLDQPLVSLSNGQTRRARILSSLVKLHGVRGSSPSNPSSLLLVLSEPYSGLDPPSRSRLTTVLGDLHQSGTRVFVLLRRQDEMPSIITDVIDVDSHGQLWIGSTQAWEQRNASIEGSHARQSTGLVAIEENNSNGKGTGAGESLVELQNVSIQYGEKTVLDSISLALRPGSRMILQGDNGSGKTTLLSLLMGIHPKTFSLDPPSYRLFGRPRTSAENASRLLARKIGYFGPDLLAAFPRKGLESGGLRVVDAIGCGLDGTFARATWRPEQLSVIRSLVERFMDTLSFRMGPNAASSTASATSANASAEERDALLRRPFIDLTSGSQAVVLFMRAIIQRPQLLILDEPFQGMDSTQIEAVRRFLQDEHGSIDNAGRTQRGEEGDEEMASWRRRLAIVLVSHFEQEWPQGFGEYMFLDQGRAVRRIGLSTSSD